MNSDKYPHDSMQIILAKLKDIASGVMHAAEAQTLELVLERIAQVARELAQAQYAALGIPDGHDGLLYFKVAGIEPEDISLMDHLPHGHGLLGAVMRERITLMIEHIASDPRSVGFPKGHPYMDRFLGTPIQVGEQLFGMLYLCDRIDGQPFNEQDKWLVEMLAGYAALAIANSQIREQQNRLTLLEERERISMELHDGVIQSLYAVGMQLELLRTTSRPIETGLQEAIYHLNNTIDDIRDYIMNLNRRHDGEMTVRSYIKDLVDKLHVSPHVQLTIDAPESAPMFPSKVFESVCQIINEAVSNALRHADPTRIAITALQNQNLFLVTVKDDGIGFNVDDLARQNGLGLKNIYHRAQMLGGAVVIDSSPGEGTRLMFSVPIQLAVHE